jgi:ABC-type sugar transport system substrate-binding protein
MFRKTIGVTVVMLTVAVSVAVVTSGPSGAASRRYTIAYVAGEPLGGQMEQAMVRGGRAAAKALGVRYIAAESQFDTEGLIRRLIARHVDAIATEGYNTMLAPILAKVRAAGILLLSSGDDIAARRSVWVNFSNPAAYAEALADALASQMGRRGEYAILGEQGQYPIATEWERLIKAYVAKAYPKMKLDGVVTETGGGDPAEVAAVNAYIAAHPHLRGLIGAVPTEAIMVAEAITEAHLIGKVFSAGNGGGEFGTHTDFKPAFVRSGATEFVYVGDPVKLGYLTVWAADYLLSGHRFKPGAYNVGGPIGIVWYHSSRQELRLGQPLTITKANLDVYANGF